MRTGKQRQRKLVLATVHVSSVDGVRGWLFCWRLAVHLRNMEFLPRDHLPVNLLMALMSLGWAGVDIFFVLSGPLFSMGLLLLLLPELVEASEKEPQPFSFAFPVASYKLLDEPFLRLKVCFTPRYAAPSVCSSYRVAGRVAGFQFKQYV